MLKAELHIHTSEDPEDTYINYGARELINHLADRGYDVLAITLHNAQFFPQEIVMYARDRGILMIPGTERRIEGKDVLLYNFTPGELEKICTLGDIRDIKRDRHLVIAPHPFYPAGYSLGKELAQNIDIFDAIEYCHFYRRWLNPNRKAMRLAAQYGKPMIGTSDAHRLYQIGHTFTGIDARKDAHSVIQAIKQGHVQISTHPLPMHLMMHTLFWMTIGKMTGRNY